MFYFCNYGWKVSKSDLQHAGIIRPRRRAVTGRHTSVTEREMVCVCVDSSIASPVLGCKGEVGSRAGGGDDDGDAAAAAASSTAFLSRQIRAMLHLTTHLAVERHGGPLQRPQYLRYRQPRSL